MEAAKVEAMIKTLEERIREVDISMESTELKYEELNKLYCSSLGPTYEKKSITKF